MEEKRKRYAVTLDVYVYAKNDYMARKKSHKLAEEIDDKHVNARTNVTEIGHQPFGSMAYRKLDDISRPSIQEKEKPLPF